MILFLKSYRYKFLLILIILLTEKQTNKNIRKHPMIEMPD
jgi:hypothetical protein